MVVWEGPHSLVPGGSHGAVTAGGGLLGAPHSQFAASFADDLVAPRPDLVELEKEATGFMRVLNVERCI